MATDIETAYPNPSDGSGIQREGFTRIRTLVVDDTRDFLQTILAVLDEYPSIDVIGTASNGLEALRAAEELRPDLVLLDVSMPVMNGLEAALRLSREMPWIRILMMSADDDPDLQTACIECGADAFLWKGRFASALQEQLDELGLNEVQLESHSAAEEAAQESSVYEFHNQHYEYYRELLEYAQSFGNRSLASSAAPMLLFHLQQLFQCLPQHRQYSMKSLLTTAEA
jgi:DNA-binding NarL/FixJ family response regulator